MLAACMLAAITLSLFSCDWFTHKKHYVNANHVLGKWTIDSIGKSNVTMVNDSGRNVLFSKPAIDDSLPITVEFSADSIYTMYKNDTLQLGSNRYYLDSCLQKLFIREDSTFTAYSVSPVGDSILIVSSSGEGIKYSMKKQP